MSYAATILADSITEHGERMTTFEVTFPRIVLAEVNTHKMLSKNSASSRAIPVPEKIAHVIADPFIPASFVKNQKGMQATAALQDDEAVLAESWWRRGMDWAIAVARALNGAGLHKALANRVLEPYAWHTAILSGTDWDNFFHLRVNPDAQGEFRTAAEMMLRLYERGVPRRLSAQEWHLPLVSTEERIAAERAGEPIQRLVQVSVARCARVSFLTHAGVRDLLKDLELYERLVAAGHLSPLEHVARPMTAAERRLTESYDVSFEQGPTLRIRPMGSKIPVPVVGEMLPHPDGARITRVRGPLHYAANLNGWLSRRSFLHGEEDILGYRKAVA